MKLKYQWPLVWCLLLLIPLRDTFGLSATDNSLWQHLLWPLVHANILHWFLNTICFMALWRIITLPRLLWGYAASLLIGYLWQCHYFLPLINPILPSIQGRGWGWVFFNPQSSMFNVQSSILNVCGLSSIIFFFLGIIFVRTRKSYRIRLALLIIISCFIPNIAASVHILALLFGIAYGRCARCISSRVSRLTF